MIDQIGRCDRVDNMILTVQGCLSFFKVYLHVYIIYIQGLNSK